MLSTLLTLALVSQSVQLEGPLYPRQPGVVSLLRGGAAVATELPTIQAALDLALDGDVIQLSGGRFAGPGNVDLVLSSAVTLAGESAQGTLVDGEGVSFFLETDRDVGIEAMTVRRCTRNDGGAVHSTAGLVRLEQVVFEDNEAGLRGGAVWAMEFLDATGCTFRRNRVSLNGSLGGAVAAYLVNARECLFEDNVSSGRAGAIDVFEGEITDCVFLRNHAVIAGGAITALFFVVLNIDRCSFIENTSDTGGAMHFAVAIGKATVSNSLIAHNVMDSGPALVGSRFTDVIGCTVVDNLRMSPGGAGGGGIVASINTVYWGNRSTSASTFEQQFDVVPGNTQFAYCNVEGSGVSLPTVIDEDPLFLDAAGRNYRLEALSPCVDAGFTAGTSFAQSDLDGTPRVQGTSADMGAYEREP